MRPNEDPKNLLGFAKILWTRQEPFRLCWNDVQVVRLQVNAISHSFHSCLQETWKCSYSLKAGRTDHIQCGQDGKKVVFQRCLLRISNWFQDFFSFISATAKAYMHLVQPFIILFLYSYQLTYFDSKSLRLIFIFKKTLKNKVLKIGLPLCCGIVLLLFVFRTLEKQWLAISSLYCVLVNKFQCSRV